MFRSKPSTPISDAANHIVVYSSNEYAGTGRHMFCVDFTVIQISKNQEGITRGRGQRKKTENSQDLGTGLMHALSLGSQMGLDTNLPAFR
jgi:hypothetical protein